MDDDTDSGFIHAGPKGIEMRVGRGKHAVACGVYGRRADDHNSGVFLERPFELFAGELDIDQGDIGRGKDSIMIVAAPVLIEPAIETPDHGLDRLSVRLDQLFIENA